uniref:Uncharacterized protein n=1 Tax=Fagus sylvatica TaxID=28930 RepID=A0A2N9HLU3_FAGSY
MISDEKASIKLEFSENCTSEVRATGERVTWRSVIKKSNELEMKQRDSTRLARHRTRHTRKQAWWGESSAAQR